MILPAAFFVDGLLSVPLFLGALILTLTKRWNGFRAAQLLTLCLAAPIFSFGLALATSGRGDISNPLELVLGGMEALPSVIIFVVMLTYNVLGLGTRFAKGNGRILPQAGRILLVLGLGFLVTSLATYRVNMIDITTLQPANRFIELFEGLVFMSVLLLGLPYLVWIIWKRPERLAGKQDEFDAIPAKFQASAFQAGSWWLVGGILLGVTLCWLTCLMAVVSFYV